MLQSRLEEVRQADVIVFPGTVARYVIWSKTHPGTIEILLIWRTTAMPDEAMRAEELGKFQRMLADVLDWDTAHYDEGEAFLHT
jgi:hypothetical protein